MSTAVSELVARAVAAEFTAAALLGLTFTYDQNPDLDLKDFNDATLAHVRDLDDEMTVASRSQSQHDYFIEISLRRKVASDTSTHIRDLKYLLEQIGDYYRFRSSIAERTERLNRVERRQIRDDEQLKNKLVMKASVILVFRGWRE